ncbi:hypothetical protein N7510_005191 [Penicillium lagena]|uniref:uncharacterized protein n=1 Tax=Penicillium lagena TaxID=94218 RepID=UPI002541B1FC|nr:uncharacterized protein N7510_005191 [Penicillium lagena]KAJ5611997.1 hypothetical protein N7510_005191 [Penicillium lagena]
MAAWLDLVNEEGAWSLVDTSRLEELVQGMPYPKSQYPCLIYFAGNSNRMKALQALFPQNNVTRKGPAGLVRLHLSSKTAHTENPIIFAESNLCPEQSLGDSKWLKDSTKKHRRYTIRDAERSSSPATLQQEVKRQLILPWTHILCLFLDSMSDIKAAQNLLQQPNRQLTIGSQAIPASMRVVMILTKYPRGDEAIVEHCPEFHTIANNERFTFLDLRPRCNLSDTVTFDPLRALLVELLHKIHAEQESTCRLFSASHLNAFWKCNVQVHGQRLSASRFDLLAQARTSYPKNESMGDCLLQFLQNVASSGYSEEDMEGFVASAFLMDAYPPEMHGFPPAMVYAAIYEKYCLEIWHSDCPKEHSERISSRFEQQFAQLSSRRTSSAIRRDILIRFYRRWGGLRSTTTCFVCLCHPPEHMMPCKHALCDTCVMIFGTLSATGKYHVDLTQCPICEERFNITIRQLPPTKHPVILSLDGGGVRGLVQLGLLQALEKRFGMSMADLPDLCTGTSVGALSAIDIFLNNSSVEQSFNAFPPLARKIFRCSSKTPVFRWIQWFASAFNLAKHGLYDSQSLAQTFKEVVSPCRRIFDAATANPTGCRVAIVASRTSDGKACVLANYRGTGPRTGNAAYEFLAPHNDQENPFLCDAAICSVAAPFYFQTKSLPGFGPLQDGGVRVNNPLAIALREAGIIWPKAKRHDLLLSVGTGFSALAPSHSVGLLDKIREGALPRLIRAVLSSPSMDGEQGFFEALNYLPHRSKTDVFRLDQAINGPLPALDDISSLEELSRMNFVVPDDLVRTILASAMFFFELDETPVQGHAAFHCRGSILCARPKAAEILQRVLLEFPGARFQTGQGHYLGSVDLDDYCQSCGYFRKSINFWVTSLEEILTIGIANNFFFEKIGGFPKSAQEFLDEQQVDAHFGRADHQIPAWPQNRSCFCSRGMKRQVHFVEPAVGQKRQRL